MSTKKPESPWGFAVAGAVAAAVAGFIAYLAVDAKSLPLYALAVAMGLLGWMALGAGVVAIGVRLGMRWARWEHSREG